MNFSHGDRMMDYWKECIKESFEDAGITATNDQIDTVASWAEGAHDNYSLATGRDAMHGGPDPEIVRLKRELEAERGKRICPECKGKGFHLILGPAHSSEHTCNKCGGEGWVR